MSTYVFLRTTGLYVFLRTPSLLPHSSVILTDHLRTARFDRADHRATPGADRRDQEREFDADLAIGVPHGSGCGVEDSDGRAGVEREFHGADGKALSRPRNPGRMRSGLSGSGVMA